MAHRQSAPDTSHSLDLFLPVPPAVATRNGVDTTDLTLTPTEYVKPTWPIELVTTAKQLSKLARLLETVPLFALDTETFGDNPNIPGNKFLSIIQVGIPSYKIDGDRIVFDPAAPGRIIIVDVVELEKAAGKPHKSAKSGPNPLEPLRAVLESDKITKLIHFAQFERGQFDKYAIPLGGVIDTKAFAETIRADLVSYSLQACVFEFLGLQMSKEEQASNWKTRELSESQLLYAALDVEIDFKLWHFLESERQKVKVDPALNIEKLMHKILETKGESDRLLEQAGLTHRIDYLKARALKIEKVLETRLLKDGLVGYKGEYGSAKVDVRPILRIDVAKLEEIDPTLPAEIVTKATTKDEIARALKLLDRESELNKIWREITIDTGRRSAPSLSLQIDGIPRRDKIERLARRIDIPEASAETLLIELMDLNITRLRLVREAGIGNELELLQRQSDAYREEILKKLVEQSNGAPSGGFACKIGDATYTTNRITERNIELLEKSYPEVAAIAVYPTTTKERFSKALKKRGADPETIDILYKNCFTQIGFQEPFSVIEPSYGIYYKGKTAG